MSFISSLFFKKQFDWLCCFDNVSRKLKIKIIHNPYENNLQINNSFFSLSSLNLQRNKTFANFTVLSFFTDYLALFPATSAYYAGRASATRLCAVAKFWALFIENTRHRKNSPLKYLKYRSLPTSFCCRLFTRAKCSDAAHEEAVDAYKYIYIY